MGRSQTKWSKHKVLMGNKLVAPALPPTQSYSHQQLWNFLQRYKRVIIKPTLGSGGLGVIMVTALEQDRYHIQTGTAKRIVSGKKNVTGYLQGIMKHGFYIIQRRIPLAQINGRPFDIRVMVQRRKGSPWTVTGKMAKVAGGGFIITNVLRSRGSALPFETAVRSSTVKGASIKAISDRLNQVALQSVHTLHNYYPFLRMVGMDMALDQNGKVWVIECNFRPALSLFNKLADKTAYRRILSYARQRTVGAGRSQAIQRSVGTNKAQTRQQTVVTNKPQTTQRTVGSNTPPVRQRAVGMGSTLKRRPVG